MKDLAAVGASRDAIYRVRQVIDLSIRQMLLEFSTQLFLHVEAATFHTTPGSDSLYKAYIPDAPLAVNITPPIAPATNHSSMICGSPQTLLSASL